MKKISEAEILAHGNKVAELLGIPYLRLTMGKGVHTGWPDVLYTLPKGQTLFIEYKALGKKPTERQAYQHNILRKQGHFVAVCDDKQMAESLIRGKLRHALKDV